MAGLVTSRILNPLEPPLLLDAAMGTELTRLGADTSPPLWSARALFECEALVLKIHQQAAEAGADILTANTFRTHERNLIRAGFRETTARETSQELALRAVTLAREAARRAGRDCCVAGSLAPLEDCYQPGLVPDSPALVKEHTIQASHLARAGASVILIETMNTAREALAAAGAAKEAGCGFLLSFVTGEPGRLLSGEGLVEAIGLVLGNGLQPLAAGVNCVPARKIEPELRRLSKAFPGLPLLAYANTGLPLDTSGKHYNEMVSPGEYGIYAEAWLEIGVRVLGSCCGTTHEHTAKLRALIDERFGPPPPHSQQ